MNPSIPKPRRGVSLIETLVIMTAASTIVTLSALLIHKTMLAHRAVQHFNDDERTAWRLSAQLRRDVGRAVEAAIEGEPARLRLTDATGGRVAYEFFGATVTRVETSADRSERNEAYRFRHTPRWHVERLAGAVVVETNPEVALDEARPRLPLRLSVFARLLDGATTVEEQP